MQVLDHLTLIQDAKSSRVTQYVRKTLAKKRLSAEKAGGGRGRSGVDGDVKEPGRGEAPSYGKPLQSSSQNPKVSITLMASSGFSGFGEDELE